MSQTSIQVIALTGDPQTAEHPGPSGDTMVGFTAPFLNNAGQAVFGVDYNGVSRDSGLVRDDGTTEVRIARGGTVSPPLSSGENFEFLEVGPINDFGQVAFAGTTTAFADSGVFRSAGSPNQLVSVVQEGAAAPGNGNVFIRTSPQVGINASGQVAFAAGLFNTTNGSSDDEGIYRFDQPGSPLVQITRKGNPVPDGNGTFTGTAFQASRAFSEPAINDAGEVVFSTAIAGSNGFGNAGIYRGDGATLTKVARVGDAAPGGGTFDGFSLPALNNNSQAAFFAELETGAVGVEPDGIFLSDGTAAVQIVREGQAVPDGTGTFFRTLQSRVAVNDAGQVAFGSKTVNNAAGAFADGLFIGDGTTALTAATVGQAVPGGGVFVQFLGSETFALNEAGQLAFSARFDPDTPVAFDSDDLFGLYLYDDQEGVIEIIREGDTFLGSTIERFALAGSGSPSNNGNGNAPAERTGLNDLGQVAFQFELADGREGVAIASLMATLLGDYSGNGIVDAADYTVWADNFGSTTDLAADGNGDGVVDAADYTIWADNFGTTNSALITIPAVPEPTSALVLLGISACLGRGRRRRLN